MGSETKIIEERLRYLLLQLQTESGILERIIYKGKNQHRRCHYFQYLLKVRRDVKLLKSAGLEEILSFFSQVINGKTSTEKVYLLERLKKKQLKGNHNFQERLLGVARLLAQMVEPILKAAVQISTLLACSFFMGFSLTVLALLARLRVLVQQMLLDVVSVFNMMSSLYLKVHPIKLTQEGIEVFREYYPPSGEILTLECTWEDDKFVLAERSSKTMIEKQERDLTEGTAISVEPSAIQYESIEVSNEVPSEECKLDCDLMPLDNSVEELSGKIGIKRQTTTVSVDQLNETDDSGDVANNDDGRSLNNNSAAKGSTMVANVSLSSSPSSPKPRTRSKNKVAFISVRRSASSESSKSSPHKRKKIELLSSNINDSEDPFFSLLAAGNTSYSLF